MEAAKEKADASTMPTSLAEQHRQWQDQQQEPLGNDAASWTAHEKPVGGTCHIFLQFA